MKLITKKEFLRHMRKGWKTLDYACGNYWADKWGEPTGGREKVHCACAIGAAAYAAGMYPTSYYQRIPTFAYIAITTANDTVENDTSIPVESRREEAIKRVTEEVGRIHGRDWG